MRILIVHNRYQQRGGEDNVVETESELLRSRGHVVDLLQADNDAIKSTWSRIATSFTSVYSLPSKRLMASAIEKAAPEVVHVHNFFPTLSPSIFHACAEANVPVVHTLHNYRILCAAATLFRDGHICEECIEKRSFLPGVEHACYRSSRAGSAVNGAGMAINDQLGTWKHKITAYIALTAFAADKLGSFRIPREKVYVKPNSATDFGMGTGAGDFALFVGRLTAEKGVLTLIEADTLNLLCMDVVVLGDGPLRPEMEKAASRSGSRLLFKGHTDKETTRAYMREARALLFPSTWYEGLPLVLVEAFSLGLPVIAGNTPNMASLIADRETGLLFEAGHARALADGLSAFAGLGSPDPMRHAARAEYLRRYTPEANYEALLAIYKQVAATESGGSARLLPLENILLPAK